MSTYLAVGSVCWDVVDGSDERRLGGSVLFASRVARAAGWDARIVTSGTAELEATLAAELPDVELVVQRSPVDTVMAFPVDADHGPRDRHGHRHHGPRDRHGHRYLGPRNRHSDPTGDRDSTQ